MTDCFSDPDWQRKSELEERDIRDAERRVPFRWAEDTAATTLMRTPHDALWVIEQLDSVKIHADWNLQRHVATEDEPQSYYVCVTAWLPEEVVIEYHRRKTGNTLIGATEKRDVFITKEQVREIVDVAKACRQ